MSKCLFCDSDGKEWCVCACCDEYFQACEECCKSIPEWPGKMDDFDRERGR